MLYTQTVSPATLGLIKQLMAIPELNPFALVGGTNLSLQFGYRLFDDAIRLDETKQTIWYQINGVKTDIVLHEYPYLQPVLEIDGIRLLSIPDIIPMKLGAITGRGAKKDFWDIAELLDHYTIKEMIGLYKQKYTSDDIGFVVRSLIYFDDAELQSDPISLKNTRWPDVKKKIEIAVKKYLTEETK